MIGIAIIWGLSNNGYGRGRKLSSQEGKHIEAQVHRMQNSCSEINFANSNQIDIIEYCEKILGMLERDGEV